MSRIRRLSFAIAEQGRRANSTKQALRLRDAVVDILEEVNQNTSVSRRVTKRSAFTVVLRSLQKTKNLPFSLREHMALKELSSYITLAQSNKNSSLTLSNTDLLPTSHPRSTREHSLTASAVRDALYKEDTSVLSYYIITLILLNNYQSFLSWCNTNNTSILQFKKTTANIDAFCNFIGKKYKNGRG